MSRHDRHPFENRHGLDGLATVNDSSPLNSMTRMVVDVSVELRWPLLGERGAGAA
jgi:hypothetical protein